MLRRAQEGQESFRCRKKQVLRGQGRKKGGGTLRTSVLWSRAEARGTSPRAGLSRAWGKWSKKGALRRRTQEAAPRPAPLPGKGDRFRRQELFRREKVKQVVRWHSLTGGVVLTQTHGWAAAGAGDALLQAALGTSGRACAGLRSGGQASECPEGERAARGGGRPAGRLRC